MWFMEEPSQFSVSQTAQSLTGSSIKEKPQTGLDECTRILLSCFRKERSVVKLALPVESRHGVHHEPEVPDGAALLEEGDQLVLVEVARDLPAEHFTA